MIANKKRGFAKKFVLFTKRVLLSAQFFSKFFDDAIFNARHLHLAHTDTLRHFALRHIAKIAQNDDFFIPFGPPVDCPF